MEKTHKGSKNIKGYLEKKVTFIFCDKYSFKNYKRIFRENSEIIPVDIYDFCKNIEINFLTPGSVVKSIKYDIDLILRSKVIYHPYSYESVFSDPVRHDSYYRFARRQYAALIYFLEYWLEKNMNILDKPSLGRTWSNKLYQLEKITLNLPEYRIQSKLYSDYNSLSKGQVIKHISECRIINKNSVSLSIKLTRDVIKELSLGTPLPFICQENIQAAVEYRCYVVDADLLMLSFSRKLLSAENVDIHFDKKALKSAVIVPVSNDMLLMINKVKKLTNLRFFAVDFFCLNDSQIKILEVNPIPSWSWLPVTIGKKIDEALTLLFKN